MTTRGSIQVRRAGGSVHIEVSADGMHLVTLAYQPVDALALARRLTLAAADPLPGSPAAAAQAVEAARRVG